MLYNEAFGHYTLDIYWEMKIRMTGILLKLFFLIPNQSSCRKLLMQEVSGDRNGRLIAHFLRLLWLRSRSFWHCSEFTYLTLNANQCQTCILSVNKTCKCFPPFTYCYYQIKSSAGSRDFAVVPRPACGFVGIAPDGVWRAWRVPTLRSHSESVINQSSNKSN